jgi:hypothetical protein
MINQTTQLPLFPNMNINSSKTEYKYQIKRFDDPEFKLTLVMSTTEENPEAVALEQLGYFVIPEVPIE